jgi:hypothetical protein
MFGSFGNGSGLSAPTSTAYSRDDAGAGAANGGNAGDHGSPHQLCLVVARGIHHSRQCGRWGNGYRDREPCGEARRYCSRSSDSAAAEHAGSGNTWRRNPGSDRRGGKIRIVHGAILANAVRQPARRYQRFRASSHGSAAGLHRAARLLSTRPEYNPERPDNRSYRHPKWPHMEPSRCPRVESGRESSGHSHASTEKPRSRACPDLLHRTRRRKALAARNIVPNHPGISRPSTATQQPGCNV